MDRFYFPLGEILSREAEPSQVFEGDGAGVLDHLFITTLESEFEGRRLITQAHLFIDAEVSITIPGLSWLTFALSPSADGTDLPVEISITPFRISINELPIVARISKEILQPMKSPSEKDESKSTTDILLGKVTLSWDGDNHFQIKTDSQISLPLCMIGKSGVVIEAGKVLWLSPADAAPTGATLLPPEGFTGLYIDDARIHLPDIDFIPDTVRFDNCYIGTGGFTGEISFPAEIEWIEDQKAYQGEMAGELFGIPCGLTNIEIVFVQNSLVKGMVVGEIYVPYLEKRIGLDLYLNMIGDFRAALSAPKSKNPDDGVEMQKDGLLKVHKEGLFEILLDSLTIEKQADLFALHLSGDITPLIYEKELDWPTFHVDDLVIDSRGNVRLEGGWRDLQQQKPVDFHGFQLAITKLGFGQTDDGGKWIGFSGGIKLVEGLPMGASVEGLRLTWYEGEDGIVDPSKTRITLNGVGVDFTVPNVLEFKGAVSYNTIPKPDGGLIHRFDGAIKLKITTINLEVDAVLVVGSDTGPAGQYTFFAIYVGVELPAGIPLGNANTAIYGLAGLFAYQMEPNKGAPPNPLHPDSRVDEGWYDNEDGSPGWYKRGQVGVTDLKTKWDPVRDSLALGVGASLGTLLDNGTVFHGKFLLAIVFPGPIIFLEGRSNLLKKRARPDSPQAGSEALFRSIAVLDFRLGTLTFGLSAQYKYDNPKGDMIDISGSAEAFFDFNQPDAWHIYIGRDKPEQYRVHAYIFKRIFEANSYFMLNQDSLKLGAWVGVTLNRNFGILALKLDASLDGQARLNHVPAQFHGHLLLLGNLQLTAFGFGATITVEAAANADVFDPLHILVEAGGELKLPWPLPSFKKKVKVIELGPLPKPPPLLVPLKEVAIEHPVVSTTWPLPIEDGLLQPEYGDENGFLLAQPNGGKAPSHALIPVVPLDARPQLTFARHVNDDAGIGVSPQPGNSNTAEVWERIGDPVANEGKGEGPALVRFGLQDVVLEKWDSGVKDWVPAATASGAPKKLYGAWAPVPGGNGGATQNRLTLNSKNAFDYTRHGGRTWSEGFAADNSSYPCIPDAPEREVCCDFSDLEPGQVLHSPWQCQEHSEITLTWSAGGDPVVTVLDESVDGLTRALCFPGGVDTPGGRVPNDIAISFSTGTPPHKVTLTPCRDGHWRKCLYFEGRSLGPGPTEEREIKFNTNGTPGSRIAVIGAASGLDCGHYLELVLPRACLYAELILSTQAFNPANPPVVEAHRRSGPPVFARMQGSGPELLRVHGSDIVNIIVHAPADETLLHQLCLEYVLVDGEAADGAGNRLPAVVSDIGVLTFEGDDLQTVHLSGDQGVCLVKVCAVLPPDPGEVAARQAMTQHFQNELARWYQEDDLFELNTIYRLTVVTTVNAVGEGELAGWKSSQTQTQYAYFRTEGPPGIATLALPVNSDSPKLYDQGKVSVKKDTSIVTGSGTSWENGLAGAYLRLEGQTRAYQIASVSSDKQLILRENYADADRADMNYAIIGYKGGLEDLTPYVRQTIPATVPAPGELPPLPRPVYRAYDTGVKFNANYVDLMYRLQRRGLALYLFDNNNRPARDAEGRLIVLGNRWGTTERLWLTESDLLWISRVNANDCATLDPEEIPRNKALTSSHPGLVLDPDTVYEARLIPLLVDEDFSRSLDAWQAFDSDPGDGTGKRNAPSKWQIRKSLEGKNATAVESIVTLDGNPDLSVIDISLDVLLLDSDTIRDNHSYRIIFVNNTKKEITLDGKPNLTGGQSSWQIPMVGVEQLSAINSGPLDGRDPNKPGTMLLTGDKSWTDYRFGVTVRSWRNGALGIVFRSQDHDHYYRFSMSREHRYRRLVRVRDSEHRILAEDYFVFQTNRDYRITVEAVGDWLRVYLDDEMVCDVQDDTLPNGGVGLYCWANAGVRFTEVRVDDLRQDAPIVYRYKFTTSRFANFFHHLHSFQDETWTASATEDALEMLSSPRSDDEAHAYQNLLDTILPGTANQNPPEVQVTRIEQDGHARALLIQSPEPVDWSRTKLEIEYIPRSAIPNIVPGAVKLTHAQLGGTQPNDEWVDLLVREPVDLSGYRIEYRTFPGTQPEPADAEILFADAFNQRPAGLLFEESFGSNALDRYTIIDEEPPSPFPSDWKVANNRIEQRGRYLGGSRASDDLPTRPGTIALLKSGAWLNIRISVVLHSQSLHDIGFVFRCQDQDNYYRFSASRFLNTPVSPFRRLVKKVAGQVQVLWEDDRIAATMDPCHLVIETFGDHLIGYLNDELLFSLHDPSFSEGKVGFYCFNNSQALFEAVRIEALEADPVLWQPSFHDVSEVIVVEEPNAVDGPADWHVQGGTLVQSSKLSALEGKLETLPGAAFDITLSPEGVAYVVGVDRVRRGFGVYAWQGNDWTRIAEGAVRIAAGARGRLMWINEAGQVFAWERHRLQPLAVSASDVAIGADGSIWLVGTDLAPGGYNVYRWDGTNLEATNIGALRIAAGPDGNAWVVDDAHHIFVFDGNGWQQLPGEANDIAVGVDGSAWIVGNNPVDGGYGIHYWTGNAWEAMSGAAVAIAVGPDGQPWLVDSDQSILRWTGSPFHQPGTYALGGDPAWLNVELSAKLHSDADGAMGIMFRYQDADNYYRFSMDRAGGYWRMIKKVDGVVTRLRQDHWQYASSRSYELTLRAVGSDLRGYLDGMELFTLPDGDLYRGQVGLYCRANNAAFFKRLVVADRTRRIGRWTIHDEGDQGAPSVWRLGGGALAQTSAIRGSAVGNPGTYVLAGDPGWKDIRITARLCSDDPGAIGVVFRYVDADNYYRFSMNQESQYRRLIKKTGGKVALLWEDTGRGFNVGDTYVVTAEAHGAELAVYLGDTQLCAVTDGTHPAGQIGLYCANNPGARFEDVAVTAYPVPQAFANYLLEDPFDELVPERWSFEDRGNTGGRSNWFANAGELRQSGSIRFRPGPWGSSPGQPATLVLAGDLAWRDYRLSVALGSLPVFGGSSNEIGVVFRYQDADNYYWFAMNHQTGARQLLRRVAGQVGVLWQENATNNLGQTYHLDIDCLRQNLHGYLDGALLFDVVDESLPSGLVGLACTANAGAFFTEIRVSPPIWRLYYAFRDEHRRSAGTRIRIFSGSIKSTPKEEPGIFYRFLAAPHEPGRLHFPADGVDIQLHAPGPIAGHLRRFLRSDAFPPQASTDWKLLRKADKTGFFLFRSSSTGSALSILPPGQYRLQLTYSRDNRVTDPDSQLLTQAGISGDEQVTIDIPCNGRILNS